MAHPQSTELHLDQHLLVNHLIRERLIEAAGLSSDDIVLEIGAGDGFITSELRKDCAKVIAIEMDPRFAPALSRLPGNVEVQIGNALEIMDGLRFNKIVSNLPFSISEPLLKKIVHRDLDCASLLVSEHFYKLLSLESKWATITPLFFRIKKMMPVPNTAYLPAPRVKTVMLQLTRREQPLERTERIIRGFVLQDDKKVKNALINAIKGEMDIPKWDSMKLMEAAVPLALRDKRVDHLSNFQFNTLINTIVSSLRAGPKTKTGTSPAAKPPQRGRIPTINHKK